MSIRNTSQRTGSSDKVSTIIAVAGIIAFLLLVLGLSFGSWLLIGAAAAVAGVGFIVYVTMGHLPPA